jgi:Icc-related predicted phosphoesterase
MDAESEEFRELLRKEERILCLICGHVHNSRVLSTGEENGNKPILNTGHYSYSGERSPLRCLNGYRELTIEEDRITSKYIVPSHTYSIDGIRFTNEYAEQDEIEIKF